MKGKKVVALAALVACAIFTSCWQKAQESTTDEGEEAVDTLMTDSLLTDADTLLLDIETLEDPLPESVDVLFDEFIFSFDNSNRLQRSRIRYPLPVTDAEGTTQYIKEREWKHRYLFLHQDFCTTLYTTRQQMEVTQDMSVNQARVQQVYLHSRQINTFYFERDTISHHWMLTQVRAVPFEQSELGHFFDFFRQFATDSIFQRHHIADPMRYTITDEENEYERINGTINADQWFEFQPEIPRDVLTNIDYGQDYRQGNHMLLQMRGIHNGLENLFVFSREKGLWRLVDFEN